MDIDIDLKTTFDPTDHFDVVKASMVHKNELKKHPAGAYFQNIPRDEITKLAAIPFKQAEEQGYFKIDFLHLGILDNFESKQEIRALIDVEPNWNLLRDADVVARLFQIHRHFELLDIIRPMSVIELADCIALIRPAKKHLRYAYRKDIKAVRQHLYTADGDSYFFKKGHAIAYALTIVLQLHLIEAGIL